MPQLPSADILRLLFPQAPSVFQGISDPTQLATSPAGDASTAAPFDSGTEGVSPEARELIENDPEFQRLVVPDATPEKASKIGLAFAILGDALKAQGATLSRTPRGPSFSQGLLRGAERRNLEKRQRRERTQQQNQQTTKEAGRALRERGREERKVARADRIRAEDLEREVAEGEAASRLSELEMVFQSAMTGAEISDLDLTSLEGVEEAGTRIFQAKKLQNEEARKLQTSKTAEAVSADETRAVEQLLFGDPFQQIPPLEDRLAAMPPEQRLPALEATLRQLQFKLNGQLNEKGLRAVRAGISRIQELIILASGGAMERNAATVRAPSNIPAQPTARTPQSQMPGSRPDVGGIAGDFSNLSRFNAPTQEGNPDLIPGLLQLLTR